MIMVLPLRKWLLALCLQGRLCVLAARPKFLQDGQDLTTHGIPLMTYWTHSAEMDQCKSDLNKVCQARGVNHLGVLMAAAKARKAGSNETSAKASMRDDVAVARLQSALHEKLGSMPAEKRPPADADCWNSLQQLMAVNAYDVLAFQETWTDEDTELLRGLDPREGSFTTGKLTSEKFKADLPSVNMLKELVGVNKSVAIVGAGPSLTGHQGKSIDSHDVVVRFNDHVGKNLNADETGQRLDIHAVNTQVLFPDSTTDAEMLIDLETWAPSQTYCTRWRNRDSHMKMLVAMRPSAMCTAMRLDLWTRGFLFYWLIGRLFDDVNLYGMGSKDGNQAGQGTILEPFIGVEHLIYEIIGSEPFKLLKEHGQ